MIKIYHNPRCAKSRKTLEILSSEEKGFEVIKYLEDVPSEKEIKHILKLLDIPAIDLIRKNEAIWKENYKNKDLSEEDIIAAMIVNPILIERPIVINGSKAVIGRPPEIIRSIL